MDLSHWFATKTAERCISSSTTFYFALWYILSVAYSVVNKQATNALPLPFTVACGQIVVGALWALVISVVAFLWYQDLQLSYIIAAAMMINLVTAALAGAYLPLILKRLDIDPALAGSVALTTVTDTIGFFAFLGLAQSFYL